MAAVGKDLRAQGFVEQAGAALAGAPRPLRAKPKLRERDRDDEARLRRRTRRGGGLEPSAVHGDEAHEAAIKVAVAALEDQRRLRQPAQQATRDDVGLPGERARGGPAANADPFVHKRAGVGAGERGVGGAQMAQPAEARKRGGPGLRRRGDLEGGDAVRVDHTTGEREIAGVDVGRDGRIGRADVLRRDQQPFGRLEPRLRAEPQSRRGRAAQPGQRLLRGETSQPNPLPRGRSRRQIIPYDQ